MAKDLHWNLENIYPGISSGEFERSLELVAHGAKELEEAFKKIKSRALKGKDFESFTVTSIKKLEALTDEYETASSYAYAMLSVNTTDKEILNGANKTDELFVKLRSATVLFYQFILDNKEEVLKLTQKGQPLEGYGFVLREASEEASHMMSPQMENLASDLNRTGCDAFSRLQEAVSSVASAEFGGEKKTVTELRSMATNPDRSVRKKAYDAEIAVWKEHETAFAAALNGVKGSCLTLEKRRGWKSPLEHSVFQSRIDMQTLNSLTQTIEKNFPIFQKYLRLKAQALGLEKLAYWDLFAPIGKTSRRWEYEEARDFVIKQYTAFNPEQGEFVAQAFKNNWIDPFPRAGKIGGAYDEYMPKVKESRVMANFGFDYDGLFTLAHELGHAWHDHVVRNKSALVRRYPMTLAETASVFGEFIVFQGAVEQASEEEKIVLIENFLQGSTQTCVDIMARFYFENELFKRREKGELVPEELCQIMVDAQKKAYGDPLDPKTIHPYMWAVKSHYYNAGYSFYNYPYAFGQLFSLGLYKKAKERGSKNPFFEDFNRMLLKTGQSPALEVASSCGCDIHSPAFWQEGLDVISDYVNKFEKLLAR